MTRHGSCLQMSWRSKLLAFESMKVLRILSGLIVVLVFASASFSEELPSPDTYWSAEIGGGYGVMLLGSSEERTGGFAGLEWSRPATFLAFRKRPDIEEREVFAIRAFASEPEQSGKRSFTGITFTLGGRWIGRGRELKNLYVEAGTGPFLINQTTQDLSSRLNFGTYIGAGLYLGNAPNAPRLGIRYLHISNGGIMPHNRGVNYFIASLGFKI